MRAALFSLCLLGCSSSPAAVPDAGADAAGDAAAAADVAVDEDAVADAGAWRLPIAEGAVCINGPAFYGGSVDPKAVKEILALAPKCIRINFRIDNAPDVATAAARHDALVDAYLEAGIQPYMLIGAEAPGQAADAARAQKGLDAYAAAFVTIVDHFKDRVALYEAFNEPNNWISNNYPALDAASYARLLARVWNDVRAPHPSWNIRIVSGALFSFWQNGGGETNAADYLEAAYAAEGWFKGPFDFVGYHFYYDYEASGATRTRIANALDAIDAVVTKHEGASKPIYISEFGWPSNGGLESDQARELEAAYAALRADPRVGMAMWFTYQDFDSIEWGLNDVGWNPRPARASFIKIAKMK